MNNEYDFLKKQRYEYYKGTTEIVDNEVDEFVEDVVDVLNQKSYNINELLKIKQLQAERIAELQKQLGEKEKSLEYFRERVDKAEKEIKDNYKQYKQLVKEYNQLLTNYNKLIKTQRNRRRSEQ